jgi:hypothetical protein
MLYSTSIKFNGESYKVKAGIKQLIKVQNEGINVMKGTDNIDENFTVRFI